MSLILPLGILLITVLAVGALWLWWTSEPSESTPSSEGGFSPFASIEAAMKPTTSPTVVTPAAENELLRVTRGYEGQIVVNVNGTSYHSLTDMSRNAAARDQFLNTLNALSQFAGAAGVPTSTVQPLFQTPAPVSVQAPVTIQPAAGKASKADQERLEADKGTMAGQIEERLQARLIRTAGMETRDIHIYSAAGGGVEIFVDGNLYESVGEVADTEVRSIIEASIRDWEESHS